MRNSADSYLPAAVAVRDAAGRGWWAGAHRQSAI